MYPYILVVVGTYEFSSYLDRCLRSLVNQTLKPGKIIVCDDCSSDNSWDILHSWNTAHPNLIEIHRTPRRLGAIGNGSHLYSLVEDIDFDFISHIDGDDTWHPEKLEREYSAIAAHHESDYAFSDVALTDSNDNEIGYWRKIPDIPFFGDLFPNVIGRRYFSENDSVFRNELVSKRAHQQVGHFDVDLMNFWDWERKIRLSNRFTGAHSGDIYVYYRQHNRGISKTFGQEKLFEAMVQVYEKHLPNLASRSLVEQFVVRLSFETTAARQRKLFHISGFENYSYPVVRKGLMLLLEKLTKKEQSEVKTVYHSEFLELWGDSNQDD